MRHITAIPLVLCILLLNSISPAQPTPGLTVPNLIRYGGTLKNGDGTRLAGIAGVTFAIYKQQDGGSPVWMETQNVTTDTGGNYSVLLGSTTASGLPGDLFSAQEQRWLGVQVQGQPEQVRVLLVSVPYAFKAHEAETLGGKSLSDFVLAKDANSTNSDAGTASSSGSGSTQAASGKSDSKSPSRFAASAGPTNFSGSTTDQIVKVTQSSTGQAVTATATSGNAIHATSNAYAIEAYNNATTGGSGAIRGYASAPSGFGVFGGATSATGVNYGVWGRSVSSSGVGLLGLATATTGSTVGIRASVASAAGTAGVFNNGAGGKILSGQNNGIEKFSVDGGGNVSTASTYQIGGKSVVGIGSTPDANLFLGVGAGANNVAGQGTGNTFSGNEAGNKNTKGYSNVFTGIIAGRDNTTGIKNTFNGGGAGYQNTTGSYNTFIGWYAGSLNGAGSYNTFLGEATGYYSTTGTKNTFVGYTAGYYNASGSSNIYIGNPGPLSGAESNAIRIGDPTIHTATYMAGIYGATSDSGVPVYINYQDHLGILTSSARFKEQIRDMGNSTDALMKLRPVTFLYKPEYATGDRTLQYGLIAEEVAKVYPDLVANDNQGQPYTVRYQYLTSMLLNELQKQHGLIAAQQEQIKTQGQQIRELQQRLSRMESAAAYK